MDTKQDFSIKKKKNQDVYIIKNLENIQVSKRIRNLKSYITDSQEILRIGFFQSAF